MSISKEEHEKILKDRADRIEKRHNDDYVAVPVVVNKKVFWEIVMPNGRETLECEAPPNPDPFAWFGIDTMKLRFANQEAAEDLATALTMGRNQRYVLKV